MVDDTDTHSTGSGADVGPERVDETVLELDPAFEALHHPRRRYLCYALLDPGEWTVSDLARRIAAWETDETEREVTETRTEEVFVSLYHAHVPKLVAEDVIEFDEPGGTIRPGPTFDQVEDALRCLGGSQDTAQESHARGHRDD